MVSETVASLEFNCTKGLLSQAAKTDIIDIKYAALREFDKENLELNLSDDLGKIFKFFIIIIYKLVKSTKSSNKLLAYNSTQMCSNIALDERNFYFFDMPYMNWYFFE